MLGQTPFQQILIRQFSELQRKNPRYSLRSFARKLQMSPSAVSEALRGKRNLSVKKMREVIQRLDLASQEINMPDFIDDSQQFRQLSSDQYVTISDSMHFAILSLLETENFKGGVDEIVERLGLTKTFVVQAIDRLERLDLVKVRRGKIISTGQQVNTTDEVQNMALQKAHQQNLDLAKLALEEQSLAERDFLSLTFAINPEDVPVIKKKIRSFLNDLNTQFESRGRKKVYKTNIQLFSLEKGKS